VPRGFGRSAFVIEAIAIANDSPYELAANVWTMSGSDCGSITLAARGAAPNNGHFIAGLREASSKISIFKRRGTHEGTGVIAPESVRKAIGVTCSFVNMAAVSGPPANAAVSMLSRQRRSSGLPERSGVWP
jgi:hypothetical protein